MVWNLNVSFHAILHFIKLYVYNHVRYNPTDKLKIVKERSIQKCCRTYTAEVVTKMSIYFEKSIIVDQKDSFSMEHNFMLN